MKITALMPNEAIQEELARRLRARGVLIEPGHSFFAGPARPRNFYRLAYSSIPAARVAQGVALVGQEIESMANVALSRS